MPAAYAVVAGGCDWSLPPAVSLSNNDVIALRFLRPLCPLRQLCYVPYVAYVACVALDGNPALAGVGPFHRCSLARLCVRDNRETLRPDDGV